MDPEATYRLADPFSYGIVFWCWVLLALFLGGVVYALLVYPGTRRAEFREGRAVSRWIAVPVGTAVLIAIAATVYFTGHAGFFAIALREDRVELSYMLPKRTVAVPRNEVAALKERLTLEKGGRRCLVIETTRGDRHQSVSIPYYEMEKILPKVRAWRARKPES